MARVASRAAPGLSIPATPRAVRTERGELDPPAHLPIRRRKAPAVPARNEGLLHELDRIGMLTARTTFPCARKPSSSSRP